MVLGRALAYRGHLSGREVGREVAGGDPLLGSRGHVPSARGCGPAGVDLLRGISRGERQQRFCPAGQALQPSLLQRPTSAC